MLGLFVFDSEDFSRNAKSCNSIMRITDFNQVQCLEIKLLKYLSREGKNGETEAPEIGSHF